MTRSDTAVCTIATRGSQLALAQAEEVKRALELRVPGLKVRLRTVRTTGDVAADAPLHRIGGKGVFTKELERALLAGQADMCVHSMKDVPTELAPGCAIGAILPRGDARDVLVCGPRLAEVTGLSQVPEGARIGTGSLRRIAQIRAKYPWIAPKGMRGNVDTRLAKAAGPDYEGAVLAAAGVERMGRADAIAAYLSPEEMVPSAGQGAIGVEVRADDARAREWCALIDDAATNECVSAERFILSSLGGSCKVPLGAYARIEGGTAVVDAIVLSTDGGRVARSHVQAPVPAKPLDLARVALTALEAQGARDILAAVLAEQEGTAHGDAAR